MVALSQLFSLSLLIVNGLAHPGESIKPDVLRRRHHLNHPERRSLAHCKRDLKESGWMSHQLAKRHARYNELREGAGYAPIAARDSDLSEDLFARQASCTLDPEVTEGPYWVSGELIRHDVRPGVKGDEQGVAVHLDINVIDVSTCQPVTNAYVELWGCNSTGVYTGVVAKGNGDGSASEIDNNSLRGIQPTAENGTASFITVVPGHYVGRTNHLHTIVHHGATELPNNTITGGTISHVGQFYFEDGILGAVEQVNPYATNTQERTPNSADFLLMMGSQGGDNPFVTVRQIGSNVADGYYGTIDVGVNPQAVQTPQAVNRWTANGGIPIPGSMWEGYPWTKKIRSLLGL
ncbi:hypothetical protein AJ80_01837 [Polytolypa hystricis UAMH7299]|uniref:Intradiol ring-cleavage dioxygenases domain-containing protein n=1 Tax=Polytolypa hystricis (strain UAMH7299) TaxID=1447883 RepID=A0A2B7YZX6_POLH7|nr:hypothetical protein AJ80_01837 [Polytolypa hystricis UAMH7299]